MSITEPRNSFRALINNACTIAKNNATKVSTITDYVKISQVTNRTVIETNYTGGKFEIYINGFFQDPDSIRNSGRHILTGYFSGGMFGNFPGTIPKVRPCPSTYSAGGVTYTGGDIRDDGTTCFTKNYGRGAGRSAVHIYGKGCCCTAWGCCGCPSGYRDDGCTCRRDACGAGEQWIASMCYPNCRPGFKNIGCCICEPTNGFYGFQWLWNRQYCEGDGVNIGGLCYSPPGTSSTGWYTQGGMFYCNSQIVPVQGYSNIIYFGSDGNDAYLQFQPAKLVMEPATDPNNALSQCNSPFPISFDIVANPAGGYFLNIQSGKITLEMNRILLKLKPIWFNVRYNMKLEGRLNWNFPVSINPSSVPANSILIINMTNFKMYGLLPNGFNISTPLSKRIDLSTIPAMLMAVASLAVIAMGQIPTCGISQLLSTILCGYNIYKAASNSDPLLDKFNRFMVNNMDPFSSYVADSIIDSITLDSKTHINTAIIPAAKVIVPMYFGPPAVGAMYLYNQYEIRHPPAPAQFKLTITNIEEDGCLVGWNSENTTSMFLDMATGYKSSTTLLMATGGLISAVKTYIKLFGAASKAATYAALAAVSAGTAAAFCAFMEIVLTVISGIICPIIDVGLAVNKVVQNQARDKSGDLSPFVNLLSVLLPSILNAIGINRNVSALFGTGTVVQPTTAPVFTPAPTSGSTSPSIASTDSAGVIKFTNSNLTSNPSSWSQVPGSLSWVSNSNGKLYGVNSGGNVYFTNNNSNWYSITSPPGTRLVQVSLDGYQNVVMGIGSDQSIWYADNNIYASPNWRRIGGSLTYVSVSNGQAYGCNVNDSIYYASNAGAGNWVQIPGGLNCVSFDGYKNIVVGSNRGGSCFYATNARAASWVQMPGGGITNISYSNGKMACVAGANVYFATNFTAGNWVTIGGAARQVSYDDPTSYNKRDYVQFTVGDVDLPGNPIVGSVYSCQDSCNNNGACIGFSREKGALDTGSNQCYLKKAAPGVTRGHPTWNTYVKPSKSSSWPQ